MAKKILKTGKQLRPKTTVKGKRYLCARCRRSDGVATGRGGAFGRRAGSPAAAGQGRPMGEKRDTTGKRVRPRTAVRGKRYRCARCRTRSPRPGTTPAPWYCPNCTNSRQ